MTMRTLVFVACFCLCAGSRPAPAVEPYRFHLPLVANGNQMAWDEAQKRIIGCEIEYVYQFHNLRVNMVTFDGRELRTTQPYLDAVIDLIEEHDPPCRILVASE